MKSNFKLAIIIIFVISFICLVIYFLSSEGKHSDDESDNKSSIFTSSQESSIKNTN